MKTLKLFSTITFISLMAWSLSACVAPKKQSPTLPLQSKRHPKTVPTEVKPSPTVVPYLCRLPTTIEQDRIPARFSRRSGAQSKDLFRSRFRRARLGCSPCKI